MTQYENLKNLMVMAAADGCLTEREINFLSDRCRTWGFSDSEFSAALHYALQADSKLTVPEGHTARIQLLKELIRMMAADAHLAEIEKQLFATAAAQMQISSEELNQLIDEVLGDSLPSTDDAA